MSDRLPALGSLRIFLAVAKVQSVSRAAASLHLTHSAVSHQIRLLQDDLGAALFERSGRGLKLTAAGAAYAERIERAFGLIREATQIVSAQSARQRLRVSCMPSLAANWLLPHLGEFISAHPEIDIEVQSTSRLADLKGGEVDVALRFGRGQYPGLHSELLMHDWHFPVCSLAFATRYGLLPPTTHSATLERQRVSDFVKRLDEIPILRSDNEPWMPWFDATGVPGREPSRGTIFDDSSLMLLAAAAGQGICLGRYAITMNEIASGSLLRPFATLSEITVSYHFVCRPGERHTPPIDAIRHWLFALAENTSPAR